MEGRHHRCLVEQLSHRHRRAGGAGQSTAGRHVGEDQRADELAVGAGDHHILGETAHLREDLRAQRSHADPRPGRQLEVFGDPATLNCDRDSQGDVYFADMSTSIVRPHCLEDLHWGLLPQRWMGRKILPVKQWGGLDVDYPWQVPQVEYWLREHGFTETATPYTTLTA